MLFPKSQVVYQNLNTSFTQLDAMLTELQNNQFTGYVNLTAWEYEGILLLDTGRIVNAVEQKKSQCRYGPVAAEGIAAKGREKDGAISVYRLSGEMAHLLMGLFNSEPVYKDLTNDLTSLDKLVAKLQAEKHTGSIEVQMPKPQDTAMIFLHNGQVLESTLSRKGAVVSGTDVLDQIIQAAASTNALFTVYRTDLAQVYSNDVDLADSFARQGMLMFWQDVLTTVESVIDGSSKAGTFLTSFKRTCVEQAKAFAFLDPFTAEFEYRNGEIKFSGRATVAQFNEGMSKCLALSLRDVVVQSTKDLENQLQAMAADLKAKYAARIEEVGLATALPDLFGR